MLLGLAVLVAALALFAWPRGGGSGGGPLNAIAQAAEKTKQQAGGRATVRGRLTEDTGPSEDLGPLAIRGHMAFDDEGRVSAEMTMASAEPTRVVRSGMVEEDGVLYMRSSAFHHLPEGREWMKLDFTSMAPGLETEAGLPENSTAESELQLLEKATGKVRRLGREDVHGVPTTRYRTTLGVKAQAEKLREDEGDELASRIEEEGSPYRMEAWIDADGLVRRTRVVHSQGQHGGGTMTMDITMDFFDLGSNPRVEVPGDGETFDATSLAEKELSEPSE